MKKPISSYPVMALALAFGPMAPPPGQELPKPASPQAAQGTQFLGQALHGIPQANPHANLFSYRLPAHQGAEQTYTWAVQGQNLLIDAHTNSGMGLAAVDETLRTHLKLPKDQGLIVTSVGVHTPAAQAGIQQNDILLQLDNVTLGKPEDLEEALKAAGEKAVPLIVLRDGGKQTLKVQPRVSVSLGPIQPETPAFWIGISVSPIEPALRAQLQLPAKHGLIALDVVKEGPAAKAGVQPHDILLKLDGVDLTDQAKLIEVVQTRGEKTIALELIREGKKQTIEVTPQRRKGVQVSVHFQPNGYRYDIIRPGTFLATTRGADGKVGNGVVWAELNRDGDLELLRLRPGEATTKAKEAGEGNATTSQRLDDLTAQVKELRQAIEALTRAARVKE